MRIKKLFKKHKNNTMKTINKKKNIIYLLSILFFVFSLSCSKKQKNKMYAYTLYFDTISSTISKPFFKDSINIMCYGHDSIVMKSYYKENFYENVYFYRNNNLFEKRYISNQPGNYFGIDTILTFSITKDTTFIYKSKRDDFMVTLIDISLFNSKYSIVKNSNNYKSIKQSLIDTTYKEIIFYDKNYNIYKYVNTWKENRCVYTKK